MRTIWIVILVLAVSLVFPVHFAFACGGGDGDGAGGKSKFEVTPSSDSSGTSKVPDGTDVRTGPLLGSGDPTKVEKNIWGAVDFMDANSSQKDTKRGSGYKENRVQQLGEMVLDLLLRHPTLTYKDAIRMAFLVVMISLL